MSILDSFFDKGFKAAKCKTLLKLTIPRIKLLRNRREIEIKQMRRNIAKLLETGQEATSRIRVENIIREENMMAAQEIIELFCELITVRLPIIETQRECPLDLKEAISSVCFAAPRCGDLPELLQVQTLFAFKYGKEFVAAATELRPACGVNRQLIQLLSVCAPSPEAKLKLLKEIAEEHELDWDPGASETELLKKNEDLLNGPTDISDPTHLTILPLPKEEHDEVLITPDLAKHEQSDSDTGFDPLDFPEAPEVSLLPGANSASASGIVPPTQAALHPDIDHESSNHYMTNKDLSQEPHIVHQDVIEEKSAATRDEISSTAASAREERQFLSSISPPSLSSPSFSSPPSAPSTKSEVNVDLQNVSATVETAERATIPNSSPPHVTRTGTEANVDLQDVLAAAHAAAETAEHAAAAARAAATLAQARISELTKKNSERLHESGYDNPFFVDTPDLSASADKTPFVHQHSFGEGDSVPSYKDFHQLHEGHQASELLDIPSFEKLEVYYDSPRSDHVVEQGSVSPQPQRLPSMDDEPYFSYPNLFASQNSNLR
ncbi:PREDICTED: uncharacterized protein LOC105109486 [Populus euphratica]|uniref:Uncharacterized protein LOC105109486 n=1 Tax=Populus euphratica TaxID=75702 RepID=A0AAJ6T0N6_POPEU|nr:PREDICTED: uncharacterized protein LOC105109486 [Populus euphratica]